MITFNERSITHFFAAYKNMRQNVWKLFLISLLLSLYAYLIYLIFCPDTLTDFLVFYSSLQALSTGENPYLIESTTHYPFHAQILGNLNPPIVLLLMSPLAPLNYPIALALWLIFTIILGLIGAHIAFQYAFSPDFLKKNQTYLFLIYLVSFPVLMNIGMTQFGAFLLFFIMSGYQSYRKNHDYSAGILWGIIIAIKFFPALLFVYALVQKRYRVCVVMLCTFLLLTLIPLFIFGKEIYLQYVAMLSHIVWYGQNWNASILGMIYRLFADLNNDAKGWLTLQLTYGFFFWLCFVFYVVKIIKMEQSKVIHTSFCFTLIVMLLMSPFGWLYYFPLLTLPVSLTWVRMVHEQKNELIPRLSWFLCFICMSIPINNISLPMMGSFMSKLSVYSFNFYGLLILLYLTTRNPRYLLRG